MDDLTGRKLGKYTLESRLGAGGMASVYRSTHPQLNRPVAIKVLPEQQHTDESLRLRFEREAQAMAALNHPTLIRIYDIDREDALIYMVMDLVPGGSVDDRLRSGTPMGLYWACDVVARVAEALDIAHRKGIVHRDIKPSNILLTNEDDPVIADFGIAKMVQGEASDLTSAGAIMGTPLYMSPEQIKGNEVDGRADVYALGIVLYQLLTGHTPFRGDTITVITKQLTEPPPPPRLQIPDLPQPLEEVVLRSLAKDPARRFGSGTEFARAIRQALQSVGTENMVRAAPPAQPVSLAGARAAAGQFAETIAETIAVPARTSKAFWIKLGVGTLVGLIALVVVYQVIKALFWPLLIAAIAAGGFYGWRRLKQRKAGASTIRLPSPGLAKTQPMPRLAPLQQGLALYRGGQFPQALAAFNQALEQNAGNVDALISRGLLFYTLGDLPKALTDFDAALQVNPRHSRARYQRALAHLALGQNDEARIDLESLAKNLPEQADLRREVMARISSLNNLNNPTALFESPFRTGQIDRAELGELPAEEAAAAPAGDAAPIEPTLAVNAPPLAAPDATVAYSGGLTGPLPGADQSTPDATVVYSGGLTGPLPGADQAAPDATIAYSGGLTGPLPGADQAPDDPGATIMPPSAKGGDARP